MGLILIYLNVFPEVGGEFLTNWNLINDNISVALGRPKRHFIRYEESFTPTNIRKHFSQIWPRVLVFVTTVVCHGSSRCFHFCFHHEISHRRVEFYSCSRLLASILGIAGNQQTAALRGLVRNCALTWLTNDSTCKLGPLIHQTCLLAVCVTPQSPTLVSWFFF